MNVVINQLELASNLAHCRLFDEAQEKYGITEDELFANSNATKYKKIYQD